MTQPVSWHTTVQRDEPAQCTWAPSSSLTEDDLGEPVYRLVPARAVRHPLRARSDYLSFISALEVDLSSVSPHFEVRSETFPRQPAFHEPAFEGPLEREYDPGVLVAPSRRYSIRMTVGEIRKGELAMIAREDL
jgi:hypothetical protein